MIARGRRAALLFALAAIAATSLLALSVNPPAIADAPPSFSPPARALLTRLYQAESAGLTRTAANAWFEMGDPLRGLAAGAPAISEADDPGFLHRVAAEAMTVGDLALARAALERLLALNPGDNEAHLDLGLLLLVVAPEQARSHLRASARGDLVALETANDSPEALGRALFERSLWPQAELAFTIAAADLAVRAETLALLALSRDYQGEDGSAWMERALARAPGSASVRAIEGMHLRLQGDHQGSLQALRAAAALAPDSPAISAQLGASYQLLGQLDEAQHWYEQAQMLAQDDPRYQALVDSIGRTQDFALDALPGLTP